MKTVFSRELAVGASLLGTIVLGNPVGLGIGYFVRGQEVVLTEGEELMLETDHKQEIYSFKIN